MCIRWGQVHESISKLEGISEKENLERTLNLFLSTLDSNYVLPVTRRRALSFIKWKSQGPTDLLWKPNEIVWDTFCGDVQLQMWGDTIRSNNIYIYRQKNKCKDLEAFVFRPSYPFRFPWSSFEQFIYVWKRRACSLLISSARVVGSVSDCLPKPISGPLSSAPSAKWLRVDHPCPPSRPPPPLPAHQRALSPRWTTAPRDLQP